MPACPRRIRLLLFRVLGEAVDLPNTPSPEVVNATESLRKVRA